MKEYKHTLPIGAKLQSPKRVYTVEQVLGQGGFGITYKVSANIRVDNVVARTSFAVKEFFMKESCERDSHDSVCYSSPVKDKVEESKKDFLAEAQRLNKISLEHPNLIHVNEVFETNNTVYYVMEYLDGGSLRSYVRKHGSLSEHDALEMMKPIFKAVDFLHQNRMTHLDIKPDNIMLKRDADSGKIIPVLIDFGLSKHYDKNGNPTSSIRILGCSDGYAPMEQYVGINTFTPQADVYALAATLLFTLTGKDPVIATELSKVKIVTSLPESVSSKVKEAIVSAMKMRKEERTQSLSGFNALNDNTYSPHIGMDSSPKTKKILHADSESIKVKDLLKKTGIALMLMIVLYFSYRIVRFMIVSSMSNTKEQVDRDSTQVEKNAMSKESERSSQSTTVEEKQEKEKVSSELEKLRNESTDKEKPAVQELSISGHPMSHSTTTSANTNITEKVRVAIDEGDWKGLEQMARSGVNIAYYPLAKHYFSLKKYDLADTYARKAISVGKDEDNAINLLKLLYKMGFYDDKPVPTIVLEYCI